MRALLRSFALISLVAVVPTADAGAAESQPPFGAVQRIDDDSSVADSHTPVAFDTTGDAVAFWTSGAQIFGARRPADGDWSSPRAISAVPLGISDVAALRDDGTAFLDVPIEAPDGEELAEWYPDGRLSFPGIGGQDDRIRVLTDGDDDLLAYADNADSTTTFHFSVAGSDPGGPDGWTSTTTLRAFGSSKVTFGNGHSYYVAYPPDATSRGRLFRVKLVDGTTGSSTLLLRRRLCSRSSGRLAGYDVGAASGAAVVSWRCHSRSGDVIRAQRVGTTGRASKVVELAHSRFTGVGAPLSDPVVAMAPGSPTVVFTRAVSATSRDIEVASPRWRTQPHRPRVLAAAAARSGSELALQVSSVAGGAALITYRSGGFGGATWSIRRAPGQSFGAAEKVFPGPSDFRASAVGTNGVALVTRVPPVRRFLARLAAGVS